MEGIKQIRLLKPKTMKLIILLTTVILSMHTAYAQYATYNHDASKMNQITVMEIGTGSLRPELYYTLLHNSYSKSAAVKNKLGFRSQAGASAYMQVDLAEQIDSALTNRAKIEALNVADRQIDIAWQTEGSKIEKVMQSFIDNINRIVPAGGTPTDRTRWTEYYKVYQTAIKATQQAYMPNSQRKKEYLRIYEDVARQNDLLVRYLVSINSRTDVAQALNASFTKVNRNGEIARQAQRRWKGSSSSNQIIE